MNILVLYVELSPRIISSIITFCFLSAVLIESGFSCTSLSFELFHNHVFTFNLFVCSIFVSQGLGRIFGTRRRWDNIKMNLHEMNLRRGLNSSV